MMITDEAKVFIEKAMERKKVNTLRFYNMSNCCGLNLGIAFQAAKPGDEMLNINGLTIAIQPDLKASINGLTLCLEGTGSEQGLVLDGNAKNNC